MVTVLGEGAFGTAIASLLADNGHSVNLWCYHPDVVAQIKTTKENRHYFPGIVLNERIQPTHDMHQALKESDYIFEAIPTQFLRSGIVKAKSYVHRDQTWVVLSKGIEKETLLLPSQILDDVLGYEVKKAVISGPSFARDIVHKQITAVTCATIDDSMGLTIKKLLSHECFRVSLSHDIIGVQLCGALKNCLALLLGMLDGAGCSESTKASILTFALHELMHVVVSMGGNKETVFGLAGIGDIVLTSYGKQSRNREVGRRLGGGEKLSEILATMQAVPESINTLESLQQLLIARAIQVPLLFGLYDVVFRNQKLFDFLNSLY